MKKHIKLWRKLLMLMLLLFATGWIVYDDSTIVRPTLAAPCCQSCLLDFNICLNNCGSNCTNCYNALNFCNHHCVVCDYTCSDTPECPTGYSCDPVNGVCIPDGP
jgi:hypothetical protein